MDDTQSAFLWLTYSRHSRKGGVLWPCRDRIPYRRRDYSLCWSELSRGHLSTLLGVRGLDSCGPVEIFDFPKSLLLSGTLHTLTRTDQISPNFSFCYPLSDWVYIVLGGLSCRPSTHPHRTDMYTYLCWCPWNKWATSATILIIINIQFPWLIILGLSWGFSVCFWLRSGIFV